MGTLLLSAKDTLQCPHTGTVLVATVNARVSSDKQYLATAGDVFSIPDCKQPVAVGPPCTQVQWLMPATRVKIAGQFAVLATSIGLCQGGTPAPPVVQMTQQRVKGM